jgi:hypothetical protein
MGRGSTILVVACVAAVLLVGIVTHALHLDARTEVAPLLTAASVAGAAVLFFMKERSDRLRKTLDVYEKLLYDRDLRTAFSSVSTALENGAYESDTEPEKVGSLRDQTSHLLNYLEVSCTGVEQGLYDRGLFRELLDALAEMVIANFLVEPQAGVMPSRKFLQESAGPENIAAVFADKFDAARKRASPYQPRAASVTEPL